MSRIHRLDLFMGMAKLVAQRSTCTRRQVGAVIVRDNRVVTMGYAGAPSGMPHCDDVGCLIGPSGGCVRTIHAEANAVAFAARQGIKVDGGDLYVTLSPCLDCCKLIINAGIKAVFFEELYRDKSGLKLLYDAGVLWSPILEAPHE